MRIMFLNISRIGISLKVINENLMFLEYIYIYIDILKKLNQMIVNVFSDLCNNIFITILY